ncbi:MAG: hypothetical protein K0S32_1819 [Bacteroidetes bacterium]|jgi:PAS domain S-box-containing protein|nr:hypothetical protein [Bacteroidota bacterium]
MRKNVAIYSIAIVLFVLSFLSFNRAYTEMQRFSELTNRSVLVVNDFQGLLRLVINAAVINPQLIVETQKDGSPQLFFSDSISLTQQLERLNNNALDTVNIKVAKQLDKLVKSEMSWLLRSNVPDSIVLHQSQKHITALRTIDSLIKKGMARTGFLFQYRERMLETSINEVKVRVSIFLGLACTLLVYTTINLLRQYKKRRLKEEELEKQEKKFRAMVENSHDLIVIIDDNLNVLYRSPSTERITGFTNEEREKRSNLDDVHDEDREKIKNHISEMRLNPGKIIPASYRLRHKEGHYIWLEGTFTSLFHDTGLKGIVINMRNVSEQKAAEVELKKSERRFRETLENMMEGVQIIGFDWRYIYVNDALTKYSTYTHEEMLGRSVPEIYPGVEQTNLYSVLRECMENRTNHHLESEFVFPNGTKKIFELSIQAVPEGIFILSVDISDHKKAEVDLQKNIKELSDYKYALDESSIVAFTDQKGIIQYVNDNFCRISKYTREELIGQDHRVINSGHHTKEFIRNLWTTVANGRIWKGELKNRASDGSIYWVDTTIVPLLNSSGKPYQYLAIRNDITERKKAEEEIIKLNRLYAFISAINQSIVHIKEEDQLLKKACDIAVETGGFKLARIEMFDDENKLFTVSISGHTEGIKEIKKQARIDYSDPVLKQSPVGKVLQSGQHEVNNDLLNDPALESIREIFLRIGVRSAVSFPIKKWGKMVGVFNLSSTQENFFDHREIDLLKEAAGDISFALENFEKASKHKITEEQLHHNERRFRGLIEKSTELKTLTSSAGLFVYASPSISKIFGYQEEEFLNKPAYDFFHPDDVQDLLIKRTGILDTPGASFNFQYRVRHKKGHWVWCDGTLTNMLHEPSINAMVSNFRDISQMKLAEEQKEFDQNNVAALINNTNDLLWSIDKDYKLITFNRPFYEVMKQASGKEMNKGDDVFQAALSEEHEQRFRTLYGRAFAGEAFTHVDVQEGEYGYAAEISFFPIQQGNDIIGTACYSRDVSQRLKQEKEREKMMADLTRYSKNLEQFAYVVSHNLRSPVANIIGLSGLLNSEISDEDKVLSQQHLVKAVTQLDVIVKDLNKILELRAAVAESKEKVNLNEIVRGIMDSIYETIISEKVHIDLDLQVTDVSSVKSYIYSIFYNLITNSIKYKQTQKNPLIRISSKELNGNVVIVFSDNGVGMNLDEYGTKVFGLYQRFHLNVSGKGMGLFMVRTQVEALEGNIVVKSSPGHGSVFTIELPVGV